MGTCPGLEESGYTKQEVEEAAAYLYIKYASGDSDDDDIIDGEDPVHPDGALPQFCYIYQVRKTWYQSGQKGKPITRPQRIRMDLTVDSEFGERRNRGEKIEVEFQPRGKYDRDQGLWICLLYTSPSPRD